MKKLKFLLALIISLFILYNSADSGTIRIYVYGKGGIVQEGDIKRICPDPAPIVCAVIEIDMQTSMAKVFDENNKLIEEFEVKNLKVSNDLQVEAK